MQDMTNKKILHVTIIALVICLSFLLSIFVGIGLASMRNISRLSQFDSHTPALPSQLLDRKGRLITEFFSVEKRELIPLNELPTHLVYALITREDKDFFHHKGFSIRGITRAIWKMITGQFISGGSTLTQQLAGYLYADRTEFSLSRKLRELWWALQLERNLSKQEILELYLNRMHFGHGTYGVEAASQFFFAHSARTLSIAESAMLVIQLANPSLYSPIRKPNQARKMQKEILNQMVNLHYTTPEEANTSFIAYWHNYDFTRSNTSSAFFARKVKAGYFTEYVRYMIENKLLLGRNDINRDGFIIHTTLDLDYQDAAEIYLSEGLKKTNDKYKRNENNYKVLGEQTTPLINLIALATGSSPLYTGASQLKAIAAEQYSTQLNPIVDIVSLMLGIPQQSKLRLAVQVGYLQKKLNRKRTQVEGALITLENDTGYILAMVGGSRFESRNQFNRAVDALVEPGSSFKPLYYAAGIEKKVITPATLLYDSPVVFWNDDGTAYKPQNYRGEWKGAVLARNALAHSMNVPSLKVLERIGFDSAISTAAKLLGIPRQKWKSRNLVRKYPIGLGVVSVSPLEMARAYATFARQGKAMHPIAVRYIEDRNRQIIINPEADIIKQERENPEQIISPQTTYIITNILQSTVKEGTLRYAERVANGFNHPMAGKTGTTQNWADAWTVGFSPYYTTAIWIGFDKGGSNSLGINQTGAITAGPIWGEYMKTIHTGLPPRKFIRPPGIVTRRITTHGLLPPGNYRGKTFPEIFVQGTEPKEFDRESTYTKERTLELENKLKDTLKTHYGELGSYLQEGNRLLNFSQPLLIPNNDSLLSPNSDNSLDTLNHAPDPEIKENHINEKTGNPLLD